MAWKEGDVIPNLFEKIDSAKKITSNASWNNTLTFLSRLNYPIRDLDDPNEEFEYSSESQRKLKPRDSSQAVPPVSPWQSIYFYKRNLELFSRYAGYDELGKDVGERFKLTTAGVSRVTTETLAKIYDSAPDDLKMEIPFELITSDKRKWVDMEKYGKRGIRATSFVINLAGLKDSEVKYEERQNMLESVNTRRRVKSLTNAGMIVNFDTLMKELGLANTERGKSNVHEHLRQIFKRQEVPFGRLFHTLKKNDIQRIVSYNFIAEGDHTRVISLLSNLPELDYARKKDKLLKPDSIEVVRNAS